MNYVLYNPLANSNQGEATKNEVLLALKAKFGEEFQEENVTKMDYDAFLKGLKKSDNVVLLGGDGTLNHFANIIYGKKLPCPFYVYKAGTGNDFLRDVESEVKDNLLEINKYVENLPLIQVIDKEYRYINGIGYGIDGMCCEVAEAKKAAGATKISYSGISIKLLLHGYKPPKAKITIDGETKEYEKVWLASAMNGRYYGGMNATPEQNRLSDKVSVLCFHGSSKFKTLMIFPKLFKGEHVKYTKNVEIRSGHDVTVEFDTPCALQIDGEVVSNVKKYRVIKN